VNRIETLLRCTGVYVCDAARIAARDASLEAVVGLGMIRHVPDWRLAAADVRRVLRPRDRFFFDEVTARRSIARSGNLVAEGFATALGASKQSGSRRPPECLTAADAKCETLAGGLGHRSELEERMAPSLGKVLLGRVIDADPAPLRDSDGWPRAWPLQCRSTLTADPVRRCGTTYVARFVSAPRYDRRSVCHHSARRCCVASSGKPCRAACS
jgi:hypothetical protein